MIQPSGEFLKFDSGVLQARIYRQSGHISLVGPDSNGVPGANSIILAPPAGKSGTGAFEIGRVIASTALANGLELSQAVGSKTVITRLTFPHDGVLQYEVIDWNGLTPVETSIQGASDAGEHFYGFGEKFNSLDQAGKKVNVLTFDQPGTKGDRSYKVSPWFISTRGYGFHLESSAESQFDLRATVADRYQVTNLFSNLKFNLVYGPKLPDVLNRYTGYNGRPALPPPWAFGPWISSDIWRDGGEIRYAVTKFRERGIPASAFVFDSPWEIAYNDFAFNMTQFGRQGTFEGVQYPGFGSLGEMMQFLQAQGLKVICWMAPFINTKSGKDEIEPRQNPRKFVPGQNIAQSVNYQAGADHNFFVRSSAGGGPLKVKWWKGTGSPVDFTNPAAADWFSGQLKQLLAASQVTTKSGTHEPAIGGFKTDDGETTNGTNIYIPTTAAYADGRTGVEMRNAYCLEYQRTVWNVLGKDGLLFARSGFAGSQAFPGHWAGDNEPNFGDNGLPGVIVAGLSAAMSGYSIWGHDIGAYQNSHPSQAPADLFMRWTQFGCFSPIMQMHRKVDQNNQYPWNYGEEALLNYQFFTRLHTRLFPYLYTYAKESSETGVPILRPLMLLNQTDPNTYGVEHTYYFGNEFIVSPILAANTNQRTIYLPTGTWYDFWTSAKHSGGQNANWTGTDHQQMPLFVREGAIVPMLLNDVATLCDANYVNNAAIAGPDGGLQFLIYPTKDSSFTVYDGTSVQCQTSPDRRVLRLTSVARRILLQVFGQEPLAITRGGATLSRFTTRSLFDAAAAGWFYDEAARFSFIKFQHPGDSTEIAIQGTATAALNTDTTMISRVLTQHNDNARSGTILNETVLNASNVNVNQFGKLFSHTVQGQIYAQPLYVPFVNVPGKGVHNVIIVATMENWLYAFDADDSAGPNAQFLWGRQIKANPVPGHVFRPNYNDVVGNIGILSTPVIEGVIGTSPANPSSGTIYLVLATWDPAQFANQKDKVFKQLLYAINLADGQLRPAGPGQKNPTEINGQAAGVGYAKAKATDIIPQTSGGTTTVQQQVQNTQITVTDAANGRVIFSPMQHMQRPALLLQGGVLYLAFGSHGDFDPYHGWVFAYDANTLQQKGVFCASPNGGRAGIWQAGEGLVADAQGNIYLGSGNGDSKAEPGGDPDLGESYIRLKLDPTGLKQTGFVTVIRNPADPLEDEDLGAASPTLLPDGFLVGGGKDGNFYLLDPSQLATNGSGTAIVQTFLASRGPGSRQTNTFHIHGSPVVYDSPEHGILVYVWGENDVVRVYRYDSAAHAFPGQPNQKDAPANPIARGSLFASNDDPARAGMPGGMLSISANGQTPGSAVLWGSFPPYLNANLQVVDGELVAYDAWRFDSQNRLVMLWRSHQNPQRDDYGKFAKFCCPTVANGKVYQATFSNKLNVYGLLSAPDGGYNFAFGGKTGLTLNGSARSDEGPIRLAGRHLFQAGSVFSTAKAGVQRFKTTFRFRLNFAVADGFTFTIQGEGPRALGGSGGGLGYGPDPNDPLDPGFKITKSIAVKFDLFDNQSAQQKSLTGLYQNGNSPSGGQEIALGPFGIDLHSGHHFRVTMNYDGTTLMVKTKDEHTLVEASQNYVVDIPAITGPTAHVGFTAATGGLTAEHDVLSWDFTSL